MICSQTIINGNSCYIDNFELILSFLTKPLIVGIIVGCVIGVVILSSE